MDKNTLWAIGIIVFVALLSLFIINKNGDVSNTDTNSTEQTNDIETPTPTGSKTQKKTNTYTQTKTIKQAPPQQIPEGTVFYTNSGFNPINITVTAGNAVKFVNNSDGALRVISNPQYGKTSYSGLDQTKSEPKGSIYIFTFTKVGVWGYENINNKNHTGFITVLPQP